MKTWFDRFRRLPGWKMMLHVSGKALFGLGLGLVLPAAWRTGGWWLMGIAIVISIPSTISILCGCDCAQGDAGTANE